MSPADPGSFRDPSSRVVVDGPRVLRLLDERGLEGWRALVASPFYEAAVADGRLISATELDAPPDGAAGALEHPRLPLITYPYEWTFSMLKDAALLQLGLLEDALAAGLTIKDATPYNIQFVDGRPVFIDIGSFEVYRAGEPWIGYRQFTRQFLFPLLLRAWRGVPFQPWLRGQPEGITAAEMRAMLPGRRRLQPAGLLHVVLQARMERKMAGRSVRQDLQRAGFRVELILANIRKLRRLVSSLEWDATGEGWTDYQACCHVERDRATKGEFLVAALQRAHPGRVVDLGANDGHFSRIAAEHGAHAIAVDGDEAVLEALYRGGAGEHVSLVLSDLANPSPHQGWAGVERPGLFERARPDLVIAYGLIHHLIYTSSIPPAAVTEWLRGFGCPVVVEFVAPEDEMVVALIGNKLVEELHTGRDEAAFRQVVAERFTVRSELSLGTGTRVLFELDPR
ncbi:MAG TPA: class I SAM-dependent methyltransferase [Acidimicrobiia bacterium]|jgi:ribosomal protein L11 methylase PrmA